MTPQRKKAEEIAACCWCQLTTSDIEMDVRLAAVFTDALLSFALDERERAIREVVSLFDSNTEKTYIKMILSLLSETDEVSK